MINTSPHALPVGILSALNPDFINALTFIVLLLSFASAVAYALHLRKPENETFKKVLVIIKSWWLIAVPVVLALGWKQWGMILLLYVVTLLGLREFLKNSRVPHKLYLGSVLGLLCTAQYAALILGQDTLFFAMLPVLALWLVPGLIITQAAIEDIELVAAVGFGLTLNIYYLSHFAALVSFPRLGFNDHQTIYAPLLLLVLTWSNDVFQFIAGKMFGKRKIVPHVSPNKTLGGFLGGLVCTTLLSAVGAPDILGISAPQAMLLGLILGITGIFGDLFFSAIKRRMGVKDFSQMLPGHGGLLDRMDSLFFTAPIFFHFLLLIKS